MPRRVAIGSAAAPAAAAAAAGPLVQHSLLMISRSRPIRSRLMDCESDAYREYSVVDQDIRRKSRPSMRPFCESSYTVFVLPFGVK